ncbi:hypothetical protein MLD52_01460 [Puniceicoccaceae bacterium K14]|nr:hypothetical protein [Puniceicoccaceae bacterium K14]
MHYFLEGSYGTGSMKDSEHESKELRGKRLSSAEIATHLLMRQADLEAISNEKG